MNILQSIVDQWKIRKGLREVMKRLDQTSVYLEDLIDSLRNDEEEDDECFNKW